MKIPSDHMITIGRHLEACLVEGMVGEISLKLLAWPHTGKLREVRRSQGRGREREGGRGSWGRGGEREEKEECQTEI